MCTSADSLLNDVDMLQGLSDWARHTRLTNMHTERMLSLIKQNAGGKHPVAERLASSGMLAQVIEAHTGAGGKDPRRSASRKELLASGVPFARHGKQRRAQAGRSRGAFAYAHRHMPAGLSRPDWQKEFQRLTQQFYSLPEEEQHAWRVEEQAAESDRVPPIEGSEAGYDRRIGNILWGMSTEKHPFTAESFKAGIVDECGPGVDQRGMRRWAPTLRRNFRAALVQRRSEALTLETEVFVRVPCCVAHPGMCRVRMGSDAFEAADHLQKKLGSVFRKCKVGDYFCLHCDPAGSATFVLLGYIRGGSQPAICVMEVHRRGDMLEFAQDMRGLAKPLVLSELAVALLKGGEVASLIAQALVVARDRHGVHLVGKGNQVEVLDARPPQRRVRESEGEGEQARQIAKGFKRLAPHAGRRGTPAGPAHQNEGHKVARKVEATQTARGSKHVGSPRELRPLRADMSDSSASSLSASASASVCGGQGRQDHDEPDVEVDGAGAAAAEGGDDGPSNAESNVSSVSSLSESRSSSDGDAREAAQGKAKAKPKAKAAAPQAARRRHDAWPVHDDMTGELLGTIVWNSTASSLDAHCACEAHQGGTLACHVNRTVNRSRGKGGRPLAFLIAWLHASKHYRDRQGHFAARLGRGGDAEHVAFEVREHFRRLVNASPEWQEAREKEHEPDEDEGIEPLHLA